MKVLIGITYYYPNISGLTIYAKRLAEGLVNRGHKVVVLTSRYNNSLPQLEVINGVEIRRSFVLFRIGKGVIMPLLPLEVFQLARGCDVINCHLPQFESFIFALIGKMLGKKVVLTHHTDLSGWTGLLNRISESVVWIGQLIAGFLADKIVPYTKDYADESWYLHLFKKKLEFIYPPILLAKPDIGLRKKWMKEIDNPKIIIGFAGRIAKQKGIPYLLKAIPFIRKKFRSFKIVFAGPYKEVIGESYFKEISMLIKRNKNCLSFLGTVSEESMATFYDICDVLVLPSDDRLESFGIVQVEAMLAGCPVVVTDLPGARVPVQVTGMGKIVNPRDPLSLSEAIIQVLKSKKKYIKPRKEIEKIFSYDKTISKYEKLFKN